MKTTLLLLTLVLIGNLSIGQSDSTKTDKKYFELSFGQSILFIPDERVQEIINSESIIIPTSSILFFAEIRPLKKLRFPVYVNLPTESKQFLIDSVVVNQKANTTAGFGVQYECFRLSISKVSRAEIELGVLSNMLISKANQFRIVPLLAGRVRLVKNDNFVMYIGSSYSFGVKSWGLIYGTGFIF
ncbi:MAG: hypothetical protein JKY54_16955 [Flavobacteriales bacterium]|nr:hypothetical protein [Flavobacteriales bacterium]